MRYDDEAKAPDAHGGARRPDALHVPDTTDGKQGTSRRAFLRTTSAGVTSAALAATVTAVATSAASAQQPVPAAAPEQPSRMRPAGLTKPVTPACSGQETPASIEGPLFKPASPERGDVVTPGTQGVRVDLAGVVYDTACTPLPGTLLEFWQCDQNGDYDTSGFALRGHQYTNNRGAYLLRTIIPRDYWGRWGQRAPHIHTQVQAPGSPVLVTQLYFPDDTEAYGRDFAALNAADRLRNRACTIALTARPGGGYSGTFDFVLKTTA
ncbi:dioxygenase [Streptomyces platensis]|uniref:Dioxygenase n=1 Tax=Streptomyces platensis TaxID=58346 RepID=A0AAE6NQ77_STRPT|nr:dioxygenase [Streptomyces platensis]OSY48353.1 Catechol 1,2-dioxygenase [Streptomyces platensis]QEV56018.1 dioxygenase [Streptomyces platensis]